MPTESTVPYLFTVDEMVQHFTEGAVLPTSEDIDIAGGRVGRNAYPALVADLWDEGLLSPESAAVVVPAAWSSVEFPNRTLDAGLWRLLFDLAGYTVEGVKVDRPTTSVTLWRGATPDHRCGWSWTDDQALARWFAERPHNQGEGRVWASSVDPARLLARISEQRPGESEYVVDADGMNVDPVSLIEVS